MSFRVIILLRLCVGSYREKEAERILHHAEEFDAGFVDLTVEIEELQIGFSF
jgi:hypothetical protein